MHAIWMMEGVLHQLFFIIIEGGGGRCEVAPSYLIFLIPSAGGLAMKNGNILVGELGCSRGIFESDCLELINACNGVAEILIPCSAILFI